MVNPAPGAPLQARSETAVVPVTRCCPSCGSTVKGFEPLRLTGSGPGGRERAAAIYERTADAMEAIGYVPCTCCGLFGWHERKCWECTLKRHEPHPPYDGRTPAMANAYLEGKPWKG